MLQNRWVKKILWSFGVIFALIILAAATLAIYASLIDREIDLKFQQLRTSRSSIFYAPQPDIVVDARFNPDEIEVYLAELGYQKTQSADSPGTFSWDNALSSQYSSLTLHRNAVSAAGQSLSEKRYGILFEKENGQLRIQEMTDLDVGRNVDAIETPPKQLGFYFAGRLRTQHSVPLSDIPVSVRLAVMAIEDTRFLEHHGVSLRATLRALFKDLVAMKWVQGGSTITQQLMKILFFSHRKVLSRKIGEAMYAFVAEARHSKEDILEAYLNEVYLGQWNTHEIHGVMEAARYYFGKPVQDLDLSESATLAGIIQRPNYFNPHRRMEETTGRRNVVLKRMFEAGFIENSEYERAKESKLVLAPVAKSLDDAAYFMDLVLEKLPTSVKQRLDKEALTIYVTINPYLQAMASRSLLSHIEKMESWYKTLKEKKESGLDLQGALIAVNPKNCSVLALQGGTSFKRTQFNRVLNGKRQPGSLFKPFVFLTAFQQSSLSEPITAITPLEDSEFEWKYEGQSWSPQNYDGEFRQSVRVREALEQSINVPTARLAQRVGLRPIRKTMIEAGIRSDIPKVPSISLGSAEVTPFELAETYTTLANLGKWCELRPVSRVYDENRNLIYESQAKFDERLAAAPTFQTVQLMKGVFERGTATLAKKSGLELDNFAGKTGTTNDYKDAWFVGFSPEILTLVWIGYDARETVGLSGAAAALPVWINFIKSAKRAYSDDDFYLPNGLVPVQIDPVRRCLATPATEDAMWEYFVPGTEPKNDCDE